MDIFYRRCVLVFVCVWERRKKERKKEKEGEKEKEKMTISLSFFDRRLLAALLIREPKLMASLASCVLDDDDDIKLLLAVSLSVI